MHQDRHKKSLPIVYTSGDPAGIGMDIIIQACQKMILDDIVVLANVDWLAFRAEKLGFSLEILNANDAVVKKGQLKVEHFDTKEEHSAFFTIGFLDKAIAGCQNGEYAAMVTGPVNKSVINEAGLRFTGHTEYIAKKTQSSLPVMM